VLIVDPTEDSLLVVVFLGIGNLYKVGQWLVGTLLVVGVIVLHNLDLDTHNALLEEDMSDCNV
jgi:hypothetical protein